MVRLHPENCHQLRNGSRVWFAVLPSLISKPEQRFLLSPATGDPFGSPGRLAGVATKRILLGTLRRDKTVHDRHEMVDVEWLL